MMKLVAILIGGGLGALSRYGVTTFVQNKTGNGFPWGTIAVNMIGCLLFGFLFSVVERRLEIPETTRAAIFIGFLGAFTTFSTYAYEIVQHLEEAGWLLAFANFALQNLAALALIVAGAALGKYV
ncbi:MAG: fluoride efflux transporter CrcB [Candidatus Sumerlaeia bacterium]